MVQYLKVGILSMNAEDNYLLHRVALHACRINLHAYGDTLHPCVVGKRHSKSNTKKSLAINLTRDFIINYANPLAELI